MEKLNIIGRKYNLWTVLNEVNDFASKHPQVNCQCECGTIKLVRKDNLKNGTSKNCGCLRQSREDLVGQKFSKLTVIEFIKPFKRDFIYKCLCDCGNTTEVMSYEMKRGNRKSCGCINSWANQEIALWLEEKKYTFKREYRNPLCRRKRLLPFDFAITVNLGLKLIEFQGAHHYQNVYGEIYFNKIKDSDKIKATFCEMNKIPLLIIPYWERKTMFDKINTFLVS